MRLYRALCAWLEAAAEQMGNEEAGGRDTQLDALVETAHSYTSEPEMHSGYRVQPLYYEDRRDRIGFQRR